MNALVKDSARRAVAAGLHKAASAAELGRLTDNELLELIRQSPIPDQLVGEARAARAERRADLLARKRRETAALEREVPPLRSRYEAAQANVATKLAEVDAARAASGAAHNNFVNRELRGRHAINAIDAELELMTPGVITEFVARMRNDAETLRKEGFELVSVNFDAGAAARNAERLLQIEARGVAAAKAEELALMLDEDAIPAALKDIERNMVELAKAARAAQGRA